MEGRMGPALQRWVVYGCLCGSFEIYRLRGEKEVEFKITSQDAMAKLRLTDALTYACIQGLTLKNKRYANVMQIIRASIGVS